MIRERRNGAKSRHEAREVWPTWFYAQMADGTRLGFAPLFDCFEDGAKNFFGDERVAWKDGAVLDVVEASIFRVPELQYRRAADDFLPVSECDSKVFKSADTSKIHPPRRLHESCLRSFFHEGVPRCPSIGWGGRC
jgi:hypothetical protein